MDIKNFVNQWRNVSGERSNYQKFWLTLVRDLFDIDKPENFVQFEVPVKLEHKKFIDCYFPDSKVIVEQKNSNVTLDDDVFAQAKQYNDALEWSRKAHYIITCNFKSFLIYNMETLEPPIKLSLDDLTKNFHALDFLIDKDKNKVRIELELSLKAGEIVAKIYDALLTSAQSLNPLLTLIRAALAVCTTPA